MNKELTPLKALEQLRYRITNFNGKFNDYKELMETIETSLKALEIISQNFKLIGNCLHAKNKYAESGWVFVKEIEDEEEYDILKEILLWNIIL